MTALFSERLYLIAIRLVPITALYIICSSHFFYDGLRVESVAIRGKAASGGQLELPAVHGACQNAIFYVSKAREVSFQVGTTALDAITMALPQLLCWRLFSIVAFGILETFQGETFEEIINVLIVGTLALCLEAA